MRCEISSEQSKSIAPRPTYAGRTKITTDLTAIDSREILQETETLRFLLDDPAVLSKSADVGDSTAIGIVETGATQCCV